jgi:hypothetical protein
LSFHCFKCQYLPHCSPCHPAINQIARNSTAIL